MTGAITRRISAGPQQLSQGAAPQVSLLSGVERSAANFTPPALSFPFHSAAALPLGVWQGGGIVGKKGFPQIGSHFLSGPERPLRLCQRIQDTPFCFGVPLKGSDPGVNADV
ncbi:hypothetical protein AAFF_G00029380 [Aldrovandia affinis]|uniref:Uncharacterized protein n=1 Tax=Aldrovandia affinis TaxID=143900 RepID=A0AAD7S4A7_9TELE|nr:hypothetical protein AAFF_G00029380 [Aldrovandia affinis]